MTNGRGVELVIDPIGGGHWKKSYKALRPTGRLGMFGVFNRVGEWFERQAEIGESRRANAPLHPLSLLSKNRGVFGLNLGHMGTSPRKLLTGCRRSCGELAKVGFNLTWTKRFLSIRQARPTLTWKRARISARSCWFLEQF